MKNITCIAIDDEPMALLVIEQFCRRKGGITLRTFSEPQIGLEAIRKQKPELVFLDIQMHSVNGLEIADISYERFEIAVGKALRRINTFTTVVPESIVVKQEYNNVNILLSDILYVEALGNYVKIMRRSGGHVLTRNNLKSIYNLLPSDRFLRIHRSYIIALDVVLSYSHTKITLKGDISLPIGIQYASFVAKRLGE